MSDTLIVVRGTFSVEDPWATPPSCETARLRRAIDGQTPRLATTVSAYFDSRYLNVVFSATDDHVVASFTGHDDPIYEEDVVEVFLAPSDLSHYFEIEASPIGTLFDAMIDSPDGIRATMRPDVSWKCEGLFAGVRKIVEPGPRMTIDTTLRIPFRSLGRSEPLEGETWRANFFRIDRHPAEGDEYSAWCPTMRDPADFHVSSAFGSLKFRV